MLTEIGHRKFHTNKREWLTASFSVFQLGRETIRYGSIEIQGIGDEAAGVDVCAFFFFFFP